MHLLSGADHSFHVRAGSGRTDDQVLDEALDMMSRWIRTFQVAPTNGF
ncbi:MAG: hypothetical protein JO110_29770 [Acetobacteraceae bacterium]|nr:hypothetical protein [Acetobacteraceae bacterium]